VTLLPPRCTSVRGDYNYKRVQISMILELREKKSSCSELPITRFIKESHFHMRKLHVLDRAIGVISNWRILLSGKPRSSAWVEPE
jgi:hypothetical protein